MSREPDLTVEEAAADLRLSCYTTRELLRQGKLRGAYKTGSGGRTSPWRIPPAALDRYRKLQPQGYRSAA